MTLRAALLALLALVAPAAAIRADDLISADRPGIANGSSTMDRGRFQLETGIYRDHGDELDTTSLSTPTLLRYGVVDGLELRVEGDGYSRVHSEGFESEDGWAPVSVGFKYRFREEDAGRPAIGLIGRVFPASGSGPFKSDRTTGDLVLTADKAFGEHWSVNPNVGVAFTEDSERFTAALAALTVQYAFRPSLGVFVDAFWQAPEAKDAGSAAVLDLGGAWVLGQDTQLDLSFGWGVGGESVPNWFWSAGVSRRF